MRRRSQKPKLDWADEMATEIIAIALDLSKDGFIATREAVAERLRDLADQQFENGAITESAMADVEAGEKNG